MLLHHVNLFNNSVFVYLQFKTSWLRIFPASSEPFTSIENDKNETVGYSQCKESSKLFGTLFLFVKSLTCSPRSVLMSTSTSCLVSVVEYPEDITAQQITEGKKVNKLAAHSHYVYIT